MAAVQSRNDSFRVLFHYLGIPYSITLGRMSAQEADAFVGKVNYLLFHLKQKLLTIPAKVDVVELVRHDGRPPEETVRRYRHLFRDEQRRAIESVFGHVESVGASIDRRGSGRARPVDAGPATRPSRRRQGPTVVREWLPSRLATVNSARVRIFF